MKKHIALFSAVLVVGTITVITARHLSIPREVTPDRISKLMLQNSRANTSILPTSFTVPE